MSTTSNPKVKFKTVVGKLLNLCEKGLVVVSFPPPPQKPPPKWKNTKIPSKKKKWKTKTKSKRKKMSEKKNPIQKNKKRPKRHTLLRPLARYVSKVVTHAPMSLPCGLSPHRRGPRWANPTLYLGKEMMRRVELARWLYLSQQVDLTSDT